jgi:hypothetical protein
MMKISYLFIIVFCLVLAAVSVQAQDYTNLVVDAAVANGQITARTTTGETIQIPVQKVADLRRLSQAEMSEIFAYEKHWKISRMIDQNRRAMRNGLVLRKQLDITHSPIDMKESPDSVFLSYQIITQVLNRVNFYINFPVYTEYETVANAEIVALAPVKIVVADGFQAPPTIKLPEYAKSVQSQKIEQKMQVSVVQMAPIQQCIETKIVEKAAPLSFSKEFAGPARLPETAITARTEINLGMWWQYQPRAKTVTPPITCPPGAPPPVTPPIGSTLGGNTVSGNIPGGCPLPLSSLPGNLPLTQPNHGITSESWDVNP